MWEGAGDLVEYLTNQNLEFSDKLVLELGTGIGLPGILALRKGAKVWFQEYNIEVLECATIPHSFMNIGNHGDVFKNATFLSGPWSNLVPYFKEISLKFDIILMAETIYEVSHYDTLLDIIDQTLTPNGKVIIAAKQTYFGVVRQYKGIQRFGSTKENIPMFNSGYHRNKCPSRDISSITFTLVPYSRCYRCCYTGIN